MSAILRFLKEETVLSAAWLLALLSALRVRPSAAYLDYIDFRSLGILWSMMVIMAGLKKHGFFARVGEKLLSKARGTASLVLVLVFLCFFFSMLITNDVALLTFVPFSLSILGCSGRTQLIVPVVVLQTLAANLGSMLTPIGNPQNLYLYGLSGMSMPDFLGLMLPYTAATAVLLLLSGLVVAMNHPAAPEETQSENNGSLSSMGRKDHPVENAAEVGRGEKISCNPVDPTSERIYGALFLLTLLAVLRLLPWFWPVCLILLVVGIREREVLELADYGLLATFIGFFIFTGNMGRITTIADLLGRLVQGHETLLGILCSQVISNVPAALLLSGFTNHYPALIIGVNLGGLGTLIASMASLISYKFVAAQETQQKGRYFLTFTAANIIYLLILTALWRLLM